MGLFFFDLDEDDNLIDFLGPRVRVVVPTERKARRDGQDGSSPSFFPFFLF